nr:uncharacterized protein LOC109406475 [Aedes albopictus]
MVFSRRPFTRSQVREAREATLKDDNFGSHHLDMDYPITLTDDSFPMDPPAVDMANPTDDNFDVDSDSPAALLLECCCPHRTRYNLSNADFNRVYRKMLVEIFCAGYELVKIR